ncbi:MAG: membrane protein insertase YidC [Gammaproteobacteria bacterium]|nr:membrane protein insertase YidC [Gammaproteobacteria bacterium]
MDNFRKLALYFALALLGVFIWQAWQKDYPPANVKAVQQAQAPVNGSNSTNYTPSYTPATTTGNNVKHLSAQTHTGIAGTVSPTDLITAKTDVLEVGISRKGGNLVSVKLLKYPVSLQQKNQPVQILNPNQAEIYIAQMGVTKANLDKTVFSAGQAHYQLGPQKNVLVVRLTGKTNNGLLINKTYTFKRDNYAVPIKTKVTNNSNKKWFGSFYYQLVQRDVSHKGFFHGRAYTGAAISLPDTPYKKLSFKSLNKRFLNNDNISENIRGGWVAMQQHYFLSTFIPPQETTNHFYSYVFGQGEGPKNKTFVLGYQTEPVVLQPGVSASHQSKIYVGPEIAKQLKPLAKGLDLTVDYGWLWWLSKIIFAVMSWIHHVVGNWGWSIILVTVLIKLIFYPLSAKSYRSMAKMREVQPRMQALKERHGDDKQALSKATMEFYKKEKINPLGGCLPIIVQIPVFFALYYVLVETVQLRQAPFIFWIHDLTIKDPYYVLPVLMGISMFLQQKLSPPPPDPTQAKMMMFLPVVFTVFFVTFPAGLVLYWLVNNCVSVLQQWWIMRTFDPKAEAQKQKKKRKKK